MPLDDTYPKAIVFIVADVDADGQQTRRPVGTGFIVAVPPASNGPDEAFLYVVTAAHVVRPCRRTWVRLNTRRGSVSDVEVYEWTYHLTEDVAVTPAHLNDDVAFSYVPISSFVDKSAQTPNIGDRAYFLGLLGSITAMSDANIPMVRSGTIGRLYQPDVPITLPDGTVIRMKGHLIDCRSYAGFSGSPCFAQFVVKRSVQEPSIPGGMIGDLPFEETLLLGLVSGHFDDWQEARLSGELVGMSVIKSRVNTGVGVITPVEYIRETLFCEELATARAAEDGEAKSKSF